MATDTRPLIDDLIDGLLARGEIVAGGADYLRKVPGLRVGGDAAQAEALFRSFEPPPESVLRQDPYYKPGQKPAPTMGQRCLSPTYKPDESKLPLMRMLEVFPLKPGAAQVLADRWQFDLGHLDPPDMAREIVRRLDDRANHGHLKNPPPPPRWEVRLDALVGKHFPELRAQHRRAFVEENAWNLVGKTTRTDAEAIQAIAGWLRHAINTEKYGLREPLERDDPRLRAVDAERAARAANPGASSGSTFASAF